MSLFNWLKGLFGSSPTITPTKPSDPFRTSSPTTTLPPASVQPTQPDPSKVKKPAPPQKFNLDADDFLPISRDEFKRQAGSVGRLWFGAWFGFRDRIPPATDRRTKLIDRGMVSHGLLTPEQLVEIHHVGDEMERLRPTIDSMRAQAGQIGAEAVEADREARRLRKEQKKREAADRKLTRAQLVAERKRSDILFLGRGVSEKLCERTSDTERLTTSGLPVLATPAELAQALQLTIPQLRWLAFHTDVASRVQYISFSIPKRHGGTRQLSKPHRRLAAAQQWILDNILNRLPVEQAAHGFVRKRNVLTNALPHTRQAVLLNLDLENFFPSITFPRVRSVFRRCGYSGSVATILALLCTESPRKTVLYQGKTYHVATGKRGLPQGACTSPALANQVARRLDKRLSGLATKLNASYTRYADDLTFSGNDELRGRTGYTLARIRHLVAAEGFAVNENKTRVLRRNTAQIVTGLVVNEKPRLPRKQLKRLRAILHRARTEGLSKQNRENRPDFRQWLEGMIAYVNMVQPELGIKLHEQFCKVAD